jgi:predicted transcriptional regulator of viral defense system
MDSRSNTHVEDFLQKIRAQGRYTFTWSEVKAAFTISEKALHQSLYRLKAKKVIGQIRKEFYAIIPPEYSRQSMLPVNLFIDDLMRSLNKRYYVGLISAAALYGAAHQQPMEYFVVTEKPALRDIKNKKLKINFFVKKQWEDHDIVQKKTDAGYINVSSPELTALDLLYYPGSIGINRTVTILKELTLEMKVPDLIRTGKLYPQTTAVQRLGYLLDVELQNDRLADALMKVLKDKKIFPVSLSNSKEKTGEPDDRWKVIKNIEIESDI